MAHGGDLSGVLADLKALRERLEALEALPGQIAELAGVVAEVAADAEPPRSAKPAPIWWPAHGDEDTVRASALRADLRVWLRDVLAARYPREAVRLTPCWEDHPAVVDLLTKAWLTWQAAEMDPTAEALEAADWQLRWRPELLRMAGDELKTCRNATHHEDPDPPDPDLLASFEPEGADAWRRHVAACAAAGPCIDCGRSVDVSGDPAARRCGGCIQAGPTDA